MGFDPKLRAAMHEIDGICQKYDCAAFVSLHSKTHGEFRYLLPEWSMLRILKNGWHIKAHLKSSRENAEATIAFIFQLRDVAANVFMACDQAAKLLKQHFTIEHKPFHDFEPFDGGAS